MTTFDDLKGVARHWATLHPELEQRLSRALALVANVHRVTLLSYEVEGSDGHVYRVNVNRKERTSTCTCPDYELRRTRCKHILAAALYEVCEAPV